jgi:hypothetical protein
MQVILKVSVTAMRRLKRLEIILLAITTMLRFQIHIAGMVATLTESESGVVSERTLNHILVLTGTAPRGGQGVGLLSLM